MAVDASVEVDDYVPFAVSTLDGPGGSAWVFLRHSGGRLAELSLESDSGRLAGFTLVTYDAVPGRLPAGWFSLASEPGLPVLSSNPPFEESPRPVRRDYQAEISFHVEAGRALIVFGDAPTRMLASGRARFFFAGDALTGVGAEGLSPAEEAMAARR